MGGRALKSGHTDTQGEGHVMSEAKVGRDAATSQGMPSLPAAPELRDWPGTDSTLESQEGANLPTLVSFWPPEL